MSTLEVGKIVPATGTAITLGDSGDTFTIPASATLDVNGTIDVAGATKTGFPVNTPAWYVTMSAASQSVSDETTTVVELDDVQYDEGFTWDAVNFKGVPGTAGKYLIICSAHMGDNAAGDNLGTAQLSLFLNTVETAVWGEGRGTSFSNTELVCGSVILELGATDYVQMKVWIDSSSATVRQVNATKLNTYMCGMKLIEA
jgi:hypothetical protein|tara:strand:+ start:254 stop:853 length:600 start_codon:yes stop_codon:yes gene_type:complete